MLTIEKFDLVLAIKDRWQRDYECADINPDGHYYIYQYISDAGVFIRATVPSGAAAPVFRKLTEKDMVPLGGWLPI